MFRGAAKTQGKSQEIPRMATQERAVKGVRDNVHPKDRGEVQEKKKKGFVNVKCMGRQPRVRRGGAVAQLKNRDTDYIG